MVKLTRKALYPLLAAGFLTILTAGLDSCIPPVIRKPPTGKPYIVKNSIEVKGENFTRNEKSDIEQRLFNQIEDSSKVKTKDIFLFIHVINRPPAYNSSMVMSSLENIRASLFHAGYYRSSADFNLEKKGNQVHVRYLVEPGPPTLIRSFNYELNNPNLQALALSGASSSKLKINEPVTKSGVLQEISRLVDSFRNNGYYKFTSAELSVKGDTGITALMAADNDPLNRIRELYEAGLKKDSPAIRLSMAINPPGDSSRLIPYRIRNLYVFPDFRRTDKPGDEGLIVDSIRNIRILSHRSLYKPGFIARNISLQPGELFRQANYNRTFANLSRAGVWQSVNLSISEIPDSAGLIDLSVEMIPSRKLVFQTGLEASYLSANNATSALGGNLFGLSMNLSLLNRNIAREAIRMTHTFRAGIELNNNRGVNTKLISSQEFSYTNNVVFPKLVFPKLVKGLSSSGETYVNTAMGFNSRLALFDLVAASFNFGWNAPLRKYNAWKFYFRPLNIEFSNLFNQTDSFKKILLDNPFLNYSYNTAYVTGMSFGLTNFHAYTRTPFSRSRERFLRMNLEESGLTWGNLPIFKKYLRRFIKFDTEWKYTIKYPKTILAFRTFLGVGVPLLGSDTNRTLPFFKQYFGGGVNSMRGWPARGIGIGGQPRIPFSSSQTIFNDRTGDLQLEANIEYRYDIIRIIPNTLTLRGAVFLDIGNIWNIRNSRIGAADSAQFKFSNLYSQMGVSAGTGFRIDFNYVVLRFDLGFRFKRPDLFYENNGWKAPNIGFDDFLKKIFARGPNDEYRQWRYENFNFGIGISYPF